MADERSAAQRCHDGIKLGLKAGIASGGMGSHRGHPVTVIVRTTFAELNQAAHAVTNPDVPMPPPARTAGGTTDADTPCSSPAPPTTNVSAMPTNKPSSPTPAASPGPTAHNHPTSTTPTTPKNSYTATPTHPTITNSERVQRILNYSLTTTMPSSSL